MFTTIELREMTTGQLDAAWESAPLGSADLDAIEDEKGRRSDAAEGILHSDRIEY